MGGLSELAHPHTPSPHTINPQVQTPAPCVGLDKPPSVSDPPHSVFILKMETVAPTPGLLGEINELKCPPCVWHGLTSPSPPTAVSHPPLHGRVCLHVVSRPKAQFHGLTSIHPQVPRHTDMGTPVHLLPRDIRFPDQALPLPGWPGLTPPCHTCLETTKAYTKLNQHETETPRV